MSAYEPVHLAELCAKAGFDPSVPKAEFIAFKAANIDVLAFVDAQMLKIYESVFFCTFFDIAPRTFLRAHALSEKVFLRAVAETKKASARKSACADDFVCNLYSIAGAS